MQNKFWHRLKRSAGKNEGFTLLETMIAMLIFAVGISAVLTMQTTGIDQHTRSKKNVASVQGAVIESETITEAILYNDDTYLSDDGGNTTMTDTYGEVDMPVRGFDQSSYCVRNGLIVSDVAMIYMSNKPDAAGKKVTLSVALPNRGKVK
jgi:prepilin-type N-terminal cleavage/methylation domain-containing protein